MRPRQFSDDDLFRVARECFLEHGADVSTTVVAQRLGVSHAALFKRVGSKEALLVGALVRPFAPPWLIALERGPDDRPVRAQLLETVAAIDDYLRRHLPELSVLIGRGRSAARRMLKGVEPPPARAQRAIAGWFRSLECQGRARVRDPESLALVLLSALEARHIMRFGLGLDYPDGGPGYVEYVVDLICGAIAAPSAHGRSRAGETAGSPKSGTRRAKPRLGRVAGSRRTG